VRWVDPVVKGIEHWSGQGVTDPLDRSVTPQTALEFFVRIFRFCFGMSMMACAGRSATG